MKKELKRIELNFCGDKLRLIIKVFCCCCCWFGIWGVRNISHSKKKKN